LKGYPTYTTINSEKKKICLWYWPAKQFWMLSPFEKVGQMEAYAVKKGETFPNKKGEWVCFEKATSKFVPSNLIVSLDAPKTSERSEPGATKTEGEKETKGENEEGMFEEDKKEVGETFFEQYPIMRHFQGEYLSHDEDLYAVLMSDNVKVGALQKLYEQNPKIFRYTFELILKRKVIDTLTPAVKLKLVCVACVVKDFDFLQYLLRQKNYFGITEVSKAVRLLDAPRRIRQARLKLEKLNKKYGLDDPKYKENLEKKNAPQAGQKRRRGGRGRVARRNAPKGRMRTKDGRKIPFGKISKLKTFIHNLEKDMDVLGCSVSGALQRKFRKWVSTLSKSELEFQLLNFGVDSWKQFSDIVHPSPKDFACDYFLQCIFGENAPESSLVRIAKSCTLTNCAKMLKDYPELANLYSFLRVHMNCQENVEEVSDLYNLDLSLLELDADLKAQILGLGIVSMGELAEYSRSELISQGCPSYKLTQLYQELQAFGMQLRADNVPRKVIKSLPIGARVAIARNAPMEDVLWRYEELGGKRVDEIIHERLKQTDVFDPTHARSNYGKLMERLLTFLEQKKCFAAEMIPHAQNRLSDIVANDCKGMRVAVLGDKSGSMSVAVRSACIISSLLAVAFNADLKFFDDKCVEPSVVPRNVKDTIKIVNEIAARGSTSMAAGLWPYLRDSLSKDLIVLVSDEGENQTCQGMMFHDMLKKYKAQVNPNVKVFLVSFLEKNNHGTIMTNLEKAGIEGIYQYRLLPRRPDTSKFGSLLGQAVMQTVGVQRKLKALWVVFPIQVSEIIWSYL